MPMTDEELARSMGIAGTKRCAEIIAARTPAERAEEEEAARVVAAVLLYDAGLGPLPPGVIACSRGRKGRHHHGD